MPTPAPSPKRLSVWRPQFALAAILLLAAFLRLFDLTTIPPPLHFDESMNGNDAMENIELGRILPFYPQNGGREGLYINIETALIYFFGPQAWMLRVPAAIFGILTVWGIYLLGAELFDAPVGLLAAFFTAASFWHVLFSRLGLRAIGAPLFAVWALYFLIDAIGRARNGRTYFAQAIAGGFLCGLGFYTYIAYRVIPALILLALIYGYIEARRAKWMPALVRLTGAFTSAAVVTVAPLAFYFVQHPDALLHRSAEISIFNAPNPGSELLANIWKTMQMISTRGDFDWRYNIAFRPVVFWPVAILFALGVLLSLRALTQYERWFPPALALAWLVLGAVPAVLSNENMPSAIRSIMMIPAVFMLAAMGAWRLYLWLSPRAPAQALAAISAILILGVSYETYHAYFDVWAKDPNVPITFDAASVEIVNRIDALPLTAPKYVVAVTPGAGPRGVPPPAQTVMFLTQSYTAKQRLETNIHYIIRQQESDPDGLDFCQAIAVQYRENVFCLLVNRKAAPKF
jgi:4-amino-4-deoxy-L-arabinose transferase-like glycosyltransferase